MAFFGFFFWIINARLFSVEQIGLATALISSVSMISSLSLIGLNTGIIRYLPKSNRKEDKINTVITIILFITLVLSFIYIFGLHYFSPRLSFINNNIIYVFIFISIAIFLSLESIYSNIFTAYRNTKYTFYKSIIGSIFKVVSPFVLATLGVYAIFISASLGSVIAFFMSLIILYRVFGYKLRLTIKKDIFSRMFKLSFGNYIAGFAASLPLNLLPVMIINNLGAKQAAFYYMDMLIVSTLNTIVSSTGQALFAEGSNNEKELKKHIIKSVKLTLSILIPSILFIIVFGKYILLFFGKEYSNQGIILLYLLSLSVVFTSINGMLSAILNTKGKVNYILMMCLIGPAILITLTYYAIPMGLIPLGYAWLIGEGIISLIYMTVVFLKAL
jgi:O-antigen/teichoic acid export membrane protein